RPAADLRAAPDDAPHPDDALVPDLASVHDRPMADGYAVPDRHGVPEVHVDDRVVLDARALPDPDPIQVSSQDRAVPDARVLPDRDVPRDHGGLRDVDHRPGQGRRGLKVFGCALHPPPRSDPASPGCWSYSRLTMTAAHLLGWRPFSGRRVLILGRQ